LDVIYSADNRVWSL